MPTTEQWYIMAATVPVGTQMVAVTATKKSDAIRYATIEVRKQHNLPKSYTLMPVVLHIVDTEQEATDFMNELHRRIEASNDPTAS